MSSPTNIPSDEWGRLLVENLPKYSRGRPKRGQFILEYLSDRAMSSAVASVLEEGAFSGKDSLFLKGRISSCEFLATDRDPDVVSYLNEQGLPAVTADALQLPFSDEAFDVTFHSGLIVLFENSDACRVIREQLRVTRRVAFVFAHNSDCIVDRIASFVKRVILRKTIFSFRRFTSADLRGFAKTLGYNGEVYYYDNALENFLGRTAPPFKGLVDLIGLHRSRLLTNEIVLVIWK